MSEERYLVEGLTAMGYRVEVHAEGAALVGYHGDERRETAHVIIRRAQLDSASNDIGFVRGKDGRYQAILSEYERSIGYGVEGLTAMGYRVEVHADGAALVGYHGDERRETAHVIIRRAQLDSASNDIGFVRGKDGRYQANKSNV